MSPVARPQPETYSRIAKPRAVPAGPYRSPAAPDTEPPKAPPPTALSYVVKEGERGTRTIASVNVMLVVGLLATVICVVGRVPWALLLLPPLALYFWRRQAARGIAEVVLCVRGRNLELISETGSQLFRCSLDELLNVSLETKTIQKVVAGPEISSLRHLNSRVAPETDVSRIVLECAGPVPRFRLSEEFFSYGPNIDWLGAVRRFLRQHGWVPADERAVEILPEE